MSRPRIFPDSCVLIEGLVAPWSASRAVLIFGRSALFTFVLAEVVIEETERALAALGTAYGGSQRLQQDLRLLLRRLKVERAPHASQQEVAAARAWIRHMNDVPVLAAAVKAKPHWVLTDNTDHFDSRVGARTGLHIATPAAFLEQAGRWLGSEDVRRAQPD